MARLTWLGEDAKGHDRDGNEIEIAGPSFTIWNSIKFPKDQAIEVADEKMIARAKANRFFKVEGMPGRPPRKDLDGL